MSSIRDAFRRAQNEQGGGKRAKKPRDPVKVLKEKASRQARESKQKTSAPSPRIDSSGPSRPGDMQSSSADSKPASGVALDIGPDARLAVEFDSSPYEVHPERLEKLGTSTELVAGKDGIHHELTLGLDFGSSCTKVVIHDQVLGESFAIPFGVTKDIRAYLLPSRVYESDDQYSLNSGATMHRNLKSRLLDEQDNAHLQEAVVAFLALVIRRARGWLFENHADIYQNKSLFWEVSFGIPRSQGQEDETHIIFEDIVGAAWTLAGLPDVLSRNLVSEVYQDTIRSGFSDSADVPIRLLPEIAAEIYGFVTSDSFDPRDDNIFLMVDIGGRTLDSSVFYLKRGRARSWKFSFYTSQVGMLGTKELDKKRVGWWKARLEEEPGPRALDLLQDLLDYISARPFETQVPERLEDYFTDVSLDFNAQPNTVDQSFKDQIQEQVKNRSFLGGIDRRVAVKNQMIGLPMFLCGGGSRMSFYSDFITKMLVTGSKYYPGTKLKSLRVPGRLRCDGVSSQDYDRLAVAFGLSQIRRATILDAEPMEPLKDNSFNNERPEYIGKEMT